MVRNSLSLRRARAFTMIELAVTLALIAALAAVLFPVIASGKSMRDRGCLSNHHQLVRAVSMYVEDFGDGELTNKVQLDPYIGANLVDCPNNFSPAFKHTQKKDGCGDDDARHGDEDHGRGCGGDGENGGGHNGAGPSGGGAASTANMTSHGGSVLTSTATAAIFWGKSWASTSYVADKVSGLDLWYAGFGGSRYAATCNEYKGSNGQVTSTSTYLGHYIDTSAAATGQPSTAAIQAEVCKMIPAAKLYTNGYYAVYTDTPRGTAGFCAWHSWGTCSGIPVQFAFFFSLDGDAGCNPSDASGLHSQGLAALANVTAHELCEARTDARGSGWYDSAGAENGDKCAWTYGSPLVSFPNGTQWKLQGEWSNSAYSAGTGYKNSAGLKGCLSGL